MTEPLVNSPEFIKALAEELRSLADKIHLGGGTALTALWAADTIRARANALESPGISLGNRTTRRRARPGGPGRREPVHRGGEAQ